MSGSFPNSRASIRFSLELLAYTAIAIGILLRFINLGSREFWYDEVLSAVVATGQVVKYEGPRAVPVALRDYTALLSLPTEANLGEIVANLKNVFKGLFGDVHPPLSFLGLHFWLRLFGNSEVALRSHVALLSVGAIGGAYGLGRFVLGHRGGLLLAALLATNPYYLSHSLNIRMYGGLVLWTILSAWAMLQSIELGSKKNFHREKGTEEQREADAKNPFSPSKSLLWNVLLIASIAAGLLTQYLFAYWAIALGILALLFDRRRWWQHGLRLGTGVLLTIPWVVWGTRQQLRNRPNLGGQFDRAGGLEHLTDVAQTLGTQLVLGDWVTSLPTFMPTVTGFIAIALLVACTIRLWRQGQEARRSLGVALVLSVLPLLLALAVDVVTGKFTVGFGWGRTMIFILPGCLLLLALCLERVAAKWRGQTAAVLLLLYLSLSIGDFTIRQRRMFHHLADSIKQQPTTPTLVAMNSRAWGNVLRLAYYIPPTMPVFLLAQDPANLDTALEKFLNSKEAKRYPRLIWLDYANPVWSRLKTEAEKETENKRIQEVLKPRFKPIEQQQMSGTMNLDRFTVKVYQERIQSSGVRIHNVRKGVSSQ